jgi:hypothetical protein
MCNAECERVGLASCDLSLDKPLCGGICSNRPKARELTCSAGDDVTRLESFTIPPPEHVSTTTALSGTPVVIEHPEAP